MDGLRVSAGEGEIREGKREKWLTEDGDNVCCPIASHPIIYFFIIFFLSLYDHMYTEEFFLRVATIMVNLAITTPTRAK